jgi:hypothetical protein
MTRYGDTLPTTLFLWVCPLSQWAKNFFPIPGLYYQVWIWVMGMGINDNGTMLIGLPVFFLILQF